MLMLARIRPCASMISSPRPRSTGSSLCLPRAGEAWLKNNRRRARGSAVEASRVRDQVRRSAPRESFGQLYPRSGRIDQERKLHPDAGHVPEGDLEGDAVGRELLAERLQVLHFESDVVE